MTNWAIVLAVVIVVGIFIGFFVWLATQQQQAYDTTIKLAESLDRHRHVKDEQAVLTTYLKTNPPDQYRIQPYVMLGNSDIVLHDPRGAISYYQDAVQSNGGKLTPFLAESIAEAAAAADDKTMALDYFKKAIALTTTQPGVSNDLEDLKATVKNLEASK